MSDNRGRTRREILADAATVAAAASVAGLAGCFPEVGGRWPDAGAPGQCAQPDAGTTGAAPAPVTPAVVEVFREESVVVGAKFVIQPDVVAAMLDAGLMALASQVKVFNAGVSAQDGGSETDDAGPSDADGGTDPGEAGQPESDGGVDNPWKVLLPNYRAGQRIGLKVNCLGSAATSPAMVRAIIASLRDKLGVDPAGMIVVWDRYRSDITLHGKYSDGDLAGAQVFGNLLRGLKTGEDEASLTDGHGFGDTICEAPISVPEDKSPPGFPRLSRILTHETDLTINCPIFKTHNVSGITGAMKNMYGAIDIPGGYHKNFNTALPKLYALPAIRKSISLTICDALVGVLNGDPATSANGAPRRILLAQDPVALDSYILALMNQLRALLGLTKPLDTSVNPWLDGAVAEGLGSRNYSLIQV